MSDYKPCAVEGGILHPCPGLETAIDGEYLSKRKGVTIMELRGGPETKFAVTRSGAILRSGDLGPKGVIMNYCPFCGAPIAEQFHDEGGGTNQ